MSSNQFLLDTDSISFYYSLKDSFIIDNGEAGVWVWNGKGASKQERKEAMRNAVVSLAASDA